MTPKESKALAKASARERAALKTRRTSSQSTDNTQSQVTESAPQVYQAPTVNVPDNLHDAAKLIEGELSKIAQSQSIILSMWQQLQEQGSSDDGLPIQVGLGQIDAGRADVLTVYPSPEASPKSAFEFIAGSASTALVMNSPKFPDTGTDTQASIAVYGDTKADGYFLVSAKQLLMQDVTNSGLLMDLSAYVSNRFAGQLSPCIMPYHKDGLGTQDLNTLGAGHGGFYQQGSNADATTARHYPEALAGYLHVIPGGINGSSACQIYYIYNSGQHFYIRHENGGTWTAWYKYQGTSALEEAAMKAELKAEIYAELLALNPGIVIPTTND